MVLGNAYGATMDEALRRSLVLLSRRGTTRDTQLAECSLEALDGNIKKEVGGTDKLFFLGPTFPL